MDFLFTDRWVYNITKGAIKFGEGVLNGSLRYSVVCIMKSQGVFTYKHKSFFFPFSSDSLLFFIDNSKTNVHKNRAFYRALKVKFFCIHFEIT